MPHGVNFVRGDIADQALVSKILETQEIDSVIHFAGSVVVPESVEKPLDYYANNTAATRSLIEACVRHGVANFIFSSTAAVYGTPKTIPVAEDSPTVAESPYGRSKLMTEWMLQDASAAHDFRHVVLRYFNVAGADANGRSGQSGPNATHLIKRATRVALGRLPHLDIFGTDYPTRDGTGVRDYIHVSDLVAAHLLALAALRGGAESSTLNSGYGRGASVREVIGTVEVLAGRKLPVVESPRRPGDPAALIADPSRIKRVLNWKPQHDDLTEIVRSALEWERRFNA
jgi:UDP-glucose 4-epimerase